jgi:molybdopterin molybdotransferase
MSLHTESYEIDEGAGYIGYREAFELICSNIAALGVEKLSLGLSANRIAAKNAAALVSYPSIDASLKDGFAVKSADVAPATRESPISLKLAGSVFAGSTFAAQLKSGEAVKVCTGAPIPSGAEAVVSGEFCEEISKEKVCIRADAEIGRNILQKGSEVAAGSVVVAEGGVFLPGIMGLAAAAGISEVYVCRRAKAAIVCVGDEIILPDNEIRPGQVYASNLVAMKAWLNSFGIDCVTSVVRDNAPAIASEIQKRLSEADVLLTSGGAWLSERDLVVGVLVELGWRQVFHHLRVGPGKGAAFGLSGEKPVFCLPGGPASNEMAFLQLALPGILRMSGDRRPPLQSVPARLSENVRSRHRDWTEFKDAVLSRDSSGGYVVGLHRGGSRLQAIAGANSIICVPEGTEILRSGEIIPVQLKHPVRSLNFGV